MGQEKLKIHSQEGLEEKLQREGFLKIHIPNEPKSHLHLAPAPSPISLTLKKPDDFENTAKVISKRFQNENYFKVKNHQELFKIGRQFTQDYSSGIKSFAFSIIDENTRTNLEMTMLGLSSYFNYHHDKKVTMVVKSFTESKYLKTSPILFREDRPFERQETTYEVIGLDGIDIIEFSTITRLYLELRKEEFERFIQQLVSDSELLFWDLPLLIDETKDNGLYFFVLMQIKNVTYVINRLESRIDRLEKSIHFFSQYNLILKGVILSA